MNISFLKEYIKHPISIGAVAPSSKYLAENMMKPIDFNNCDCIVEYGAGTGIFTGELIKRRKKDTKLLIIEKNEKFYNILMQKFRNIENVFIINGDAQKLKSYLSAYNIPAVDYIISGLPFASLPSEISDRILYITRRTLAESKGKFITFQYTLFKKALFERFFNIRDISTTIKNIPPAFVLTMTPKIKRRKS